MRKIIFATLFLLAVGLQLYGHAHAAPTMTLPSSEIAVPPMFFPPAHYDHPFDGDVVIRSGGFLWTIWNCGWAYACTPIGGDQGTNEGHCTIKVMRIGTWTPSGYINQEGFHNLVRHETGHCNGWPANHPAS